MKKSDIDRFFTELGKEARVPIRIYLTGGIASWFMGGERPTEDIDFGLRVPQGKWAEAERGIQETSRRLGIPVQFSEEIGRWGMIGVSEYEKGAKLYKKFGKVAVYLLSVPAWSVGKINRYYQSDVEDLRAVFRKQKPDPQKVIRIWAKSLRESPKSSAHLLFLKTAEDFLKNYGKEIWGGRFDPQRHREEFLKLARGE